MNIKTQTESNTIEYIDAKVLLQKYKFLNKQYLYFSPDYCIYENQ